MGKNTLTSGQTKFLKAVAAGDAAGFHVRVTKPVMEAGLVFPRPGALFPFIVGCNGQTTSDYHLTPSGAEYLTEMFGWQFNVAP